jgi:uncharacterized cupin superfamily protein
MISLEDLTKAVTKEEFEKSMYDALGTLGISTTSWKAGSVPRAQVTSSAIMMAAQSTLSALVARAGFLELSSGDWLTLVAYYVYNVRRDDATFATGEVTLTNGGGGVFDYDPGDVVFLNSSTGKTYRNTEVIHLGSLEEITVAIQAVEAGAASTSVPTAIDTLETTMTAVTVSNDEAVVGQDEQSDPSLIAECLEKLGALSPFGPWDAYSFAAKNAKRADSVLVGVTRVRSTKDGYGNVTTYVATATGAVTGDADDDTTDLGVVNAAIQRNAAPLAVTAFVESAAPVVVAVTYEIWAYNTSGLTDPQIKNLVATNLAVLMSVQPVGGNVIGVDSGKLYLSAIETTIQMARPEIFRVEVSLPAGDVTLDVNEVPVLGTVVGTINQVPPPEGFF